MLGLCSMMRRPSLMAKAPKSEVSEPDPLDDLIIGFGARVKEARKQAGLTHAQFAEATGLAPSYLYTVEKIGWNVSLKTLGKLASALKVSPRDLLPEPYPDASSGTSIRQIATAIEHLASERMSTDAVLLEQIRVLITLLPGPQASRRSDED